MTPPINFSPQNVVNRFTQQSEPYEEGANPGTIRVYRFGDQNQPNNWLSLLRQRNRSGFTRPVDGSLNNSALEQTSFGNKATNATENPFISVATDPQSLRDNGETWVQGILNNSPHLGVFDVPSESLFRPSPTKSISRSETEWLYYDGDNELSDHNFDWRPNPYNQNAATQLNPVTGPNTLPDNTLPDNTLQDNTLANFGVGE